MKHAFGVNIKRTTSSNNVGASNYAIVSTSSKSSYTTRPYILYAPGPLNPQVANA